MCRPGCPETQTQPSTCLSLPTAGTKGVHHHCYASPIFFSIQFYQVNLLSRSTATLPGTVNCSELHKKPASSLQLTPPTSDSRFRRKEISIWSCLPLHSIARLGKCLVLTFCFLKGDQIVTKDHRNEPPYFKVLGRERWDYLSALQTGWLERVHACADVWRRPTDIGALGQ